MCSDKEGGNIHCPKCQKEMGNFEVSEQDYLVCENKKCEYYGIQRLDTEEYDFDVSEIANAHTPDFSPGISIRRFLSTLKNHRLLGSNENPQGDFRNLEKLRLFKVHSDTPPALAGG